MKQARKKSGSFSDGAKAPVFKGGLDWEAIRHGNRPREEWGEPLPEKLQLDLADIDRRNRGVNTYYGPDKEEQKKEARRKGGKRSRPAPFDVDEVIRLYRDEKVGVADIALRVSSSPETVRKYLRKAEVYEPQRDKHRPKRPADTYTKKTECVRGHDLTVEGARYPSGSCKKCKQEDNQKNYSWDNDPRNPKNGGKKPPLTEDQRSEQNRRQNEARARARLACPDEACGHGGIKHGERCQVRDCKCLRSHTDLKIFWMAKDEDAA